jgi:branched-chain amino acid transport system substrate-binding protein
VAASGHWNSPVALATMHTFHSFKVPFMVWGAISPRITEFNYPGVTRICPTLVQENVPFAEWVIEDLGYKTFSIISDTTDYGEQNTKGLQVPGGKTQRQDSLRGCRAHGNYGFQAHPDQDQRSQSMLPSTSAAWSWKAHSPGARWKSWRIDKLFCAVSGLADEKFNEVAGKSAEGVIITKPGFDLDELAARHRVQESL